MKTRVPLVVLGVFAALSIQVHGQYKTFILHPASALYPKETNFVVEAGVAVEAVRVQMYSASTSLAKVSFSGLPFLDPFTGQTAEKKFDFLKGDVVVGPATINMRCVFGGADAPNPAFFTLRIIRQADLSTPNTAVVIPADAKGPVEIVLESSTDLANWSQALPGTYGTSSQQRYFRLRALQQ